MNDRTGASKELWLMLLRCGEWLTGSETRERLGAECANPTKQLFDMARHGSILVRKRAGSTAREFTVTPTCKVARGVSVKELQEALAASEATA